MSRADGKAERDRIEAERAVREAIAAKQAAAQSSSVPKRPAETTAERHRRIAEKTREAFAELDEIDPPKRKPVTSYSETENPRTAVSRSRTEVQPRQDSSQSNRNSTPRPANRTATGGNAQRNAKSSSEPWITSSKTASQTQQTNRKENAQKKKNGPLTIVIFVVCLCVFGFSAYKVADYFISAHIRDSGYRSTIGDVENIDGQVPDWGGIVDNPANHGNGGDSDTKTEIKVVPVEDVDIGEIKYIDTNYSKLKQENPDVKGWIYFPGPSSIYGLPINAALVQGDDDYHYLDYNAKGEKDSNGCIYMSAGLDPDLVKNSNTMIYGHAKNPYAFAGLKYLNDAKRWYSDGNNHFIRIKTDNYYSIWQIFSWYESTDGGDFDRLSTDNWAEYFTYLQGLNEIPSLGKFEFKDEDKIISLVTCKGFSDGRVVVHAKLVRYSPVSG